MRLTVLGKSPSWQDADGACSGYLLEEDGTTLLVDCGNGVFSKLRRFRDYTPCRRGRAVAPPRGPLPRPRPVLVRAHLRAAPAARARRSLAGDRQPGPAAAARAAGGDRDLPPCRRRVGQRGPDRERVRHRGVRRVLDARGRPARDRVPRRCRTSPRRSRSRSSSKRTAGGSSTGPIRVPPRR